MINMINMINIINIITQQQVEKQLLSAVKLY